jgi:hypothetical protein
MTLAYTQVISGAITQALRNARDAVTAIDASPRATDVQGFIDLLFGTEQQAAVVQTGRGKHQPSLEKQALNLNQIVWMTSQT